MTLDATQGEEARVTEERVRALADGLHSRCQCTSAMAPPCKAKQDADAIDALLERVARAEEALQDRGVWSFRTLMYVADRLLAEHYPDDIFPDLDDPQVEGDPGPALVRALRRCRAALPEEATP